MNAVVTGYEKTRKVVILEARDEERSTRSYVEEAVELLHIKKCELSNELEVRLLCQVEKLLDEKGIIMPSRIEFLPKISGICLKICGKEVDIMPADTVESVMARL